MGGGGERKRIKQKKSQDRRDEMSNIKESESMLVVKFSFIYFTFCPIASLAVHVGLWNGVDRMVGLCFSSSSSFVFLFFSACNQTHRRRLHGSLRSAKC